MQPLSSWLAPLGLRLLLTGIPVLVLGQAALVVTSWNLATPDINVYVDIEDHNINLFFDIEYSKFDIDVTVFDIVVTKKTLIPTKR